MALIAVTVVALPFTTQGAENTPAPANYTSASLALLDEPEPPTPAPRIEKTSAAPSDPLGQWSIVSSGETNVLYTVRWINHQFVVLGTKAILTSPDGINWQNNAGNLTNIFIDVVGNDSASNFIAIGDNGTIATSPDLKKWTPQTSPTTVRLFTAFWYNGQFLALGNGGTTLTSPDGTHWVDVANNTSETFHRGTQVGGRLIVASYEGIVSSPNGLVWSRALRSSNRMVDVATNGKLVVAVGGTPDNFRVSTDGVTWSPYSLGTTEQLNAVIWTGNQFVAAGGNGTILNSPDGATWSLRTLGGNYTIEGVAGHDNTFVAVTSAGLIFTNQKVATVARPEISFAPGPAGSVPQLELKCATANAKIVYTEDGTDPTSQSTTYTAPFSPTQSETIKVRAYKDGLAQSAISSAKFIINPPKAQP